MTFEPGAEWTMPAAAEGVARVLYVFHGDGIVIGGEPVGASTGAVVDATRDLGITSAGTTEMLVMQGRPIGEPVAQQGPFVMNTEDEIRQAFTDYRATQFGGWPWDGPDPTHGHDDTRFAAPRGRPSGVRQPRRGVAQLSVVSAWPLPAWFVPPWFFPAWFWSSAITVALFIMFVSASAAPLTALAAPAVAWA